MKQRFFYLSFVMAMPFLTAIAQTPMATLEHEQNLKTFNGTKSFANALNEAQDGDIIYLTPGRYSGADITKQVAIKGTGYVQDDKENLQGSYIGVNEEVHIKLPEGKGLNVSGVCFSTNTYIESDITASTFQDCKFMKVLRLDATTSNVTFKDCEAGECIYIYKDQSNMLYLNSIFNTIYDYTNGSSTLFFKNCILQNLYGGGYKLKAATIENSINTWDKSDEPGVKYINSIICGSVDNSQKQNCWELSREDISKLWGGNWWILTAEAAANYIGTDGKQIGLYGGKQPFTKTVSGLRISKIDVPAETDENGNISITISVSNDEL